MYNRFFLKQCSALAVASIFSGAAHSASITIENDVITQFGITQAKLNSSNGTWIDGRYLPYVNHGQYFSIAINGLHTTITEKPNINCNYWVALEHLDNVPFAILQAGDESCGGHGQIVYSEEAKKLLNQPHIRVGGYAFTDKDTIAMMKSDDQAEVATVYPEATKYLYLNHSNPQTDKLAQFEVEVVDPWYDKVRLRLRHNAGTHADKYLMKVDDVDKLSITSDVEPAPEQGSVFQINVISDETAREKGLTAGAQIISHDGGYLTQSNFDDHSLYLGDEEGSSTFRVATVDRLSGINNVPNVPSKDPASLALAQKAEVADFESFHAPLKEKDYPENLTFRINEVPDVSQTSDYFKGAHGVFLEASYDEVFNILASVKRQSKVIGADYIYPMKAVITVQDLDHNQYQIFDRFHMSQSDWVNLKSKANAASAHNDAGTFTDLGKITLPTYVEKTQLMYIADTKCNSRNSVAYSQSANLCTTYATGFDDLATNDATPRFLAVKLTTPELASKVDKFSHKKMVSAASAVYKEAQNYLFSEQFLQRKSNLDAQGYLGYLATVGIPNEDKVKLRNYFKNTIGVNELSVMRPAAKFPDVHSTYLTEYAKGTDWFKELKSRHHFLSMGIYTPHLSTFAFEKFAHMPAHANYTASPYSLLPAYDAPLVIFGTAIAALQTIEKLQGKDSAHDFYVRNGQNYHKLYKASVLVMNQYGKKWVPAGDRTLRRESIIYHAAYEYAQRAYNSPNEVLQSFCSLNDTSKKAQLSENALSDCGLVQLHKEEQDIAVLKQHQIARFMRVEKTQISGGWDEILLPLISGPLLDYVFTGSLFGEEFNPLLEEFATSDASDIELETLSSGEAAEGEAGEIAEGEAVTTEFGEELSSTRFGQLCSI